MGPRVVGTTGQVIQREVYRASVVLAASRVDKQERPDQLRVAGARGVCGTALHENRRVVAST